MENKIDVHGIVLKHRAAGEYDWLVTLLTAERGKLNAFARGARRPNTRLSGNVEPFCFGTFTLFDGRSSYGLNDAQIDYFFETFRQDLETASYGTFFLELADYYARENLEATDLLNLLYLSLKALETKEKGFSNRLLRCVYELRALVVEGYFPGADAFASSSGAVRRALNHVATAPLTKLYTFTLNDDALAELCDVTERLRRRFVDKKLNSLDMLSLYETPVMKPADKTDH